MIPKLDYYIGRPVQAVEAGEEDYDWSIRFEDNVIVRNTDKDRTTMPDTAIQGMVFFMAMFDPDETRMQFGHYEDGEPAVDTEVILSPLQYSISDERFEGGPHFPQRDPEPSPEDELPEDPSPERVADGPEEP